MAIYVLQAKIIARKNRGRSVVAASAYRSGKKLYDELRNQVADYLRRTRGIVQTEIFLPKDAPAWASDPGTLWNSVERSEKRKDAQLAREFVLAMPIELDAKQQWALAVEWAQTELVAKGMAAEISLHNPKSGKNPHVHILCTLRPFEGDQFSSKKERDWNSKQMLAGWRKSWEVAANAALEKAGSDARIDSRSLKDQGIDRLPEPKIGVAATAMQRKGVDTERHKLVRFIKALNFAKPWFDAIQKKGEVHQIGMGSNWWERSLIFMAQRKEVVKETVLSTWNKFKGVKPDHHPKPPAPSRGPEPEL